MQPGVANVSLLTPHSLFTSVPPLRDFRPHSLLQLRGCEHFDAAAKPNVVAESPRHIMIRDTMGHFAHQRGQLTVFLRLLDVPVPAIYGPSADDARFDYRISPGTL